MQTSILDNVGRIFSVITKKVRQSFSMFYWVVSDYKKAYKAQATVRPHCPFLAFLARFLEGLHKHKKKEQIFFSCAYAYNSSLSK